MSRDDDRAWLSALLNREGGPGAFHPDEGARLAGALSGMPFVELLGLLPPSPAPVAAYQAWLAVNGQAADAFAGWFNLGAALHAAGQAQAAANAFATALALRPGLHDAALNLGLALEAAGDADGALAAWRRALPPPAMRRSLHNHIGRVLERRGLLAEAAAELEQSLLLDPMQPDVVQHWMHLRQRMCEWPVDGRALPGLPAETLRRWCGPLGTLALTDSVAAQVAANAEWLERKVPPVSERLAPARGYGGARIRLGYLSSDFCRHAVSHLMAEVLERHDRAAFEVIGYCSSPEDGSEIQRRVLAALDRHVPIGAMSDEAAARRIRADEVDILVDLNGLTRGARPGLLRWKPAPVQLTYLGYIGPVPLPELDGMLCDEWSVPPEAAPLYRPPPLVIQGGFQANDGQDLVLPAVSRAGEGLPEDGFVLCCFSQTYKFTPEMFAAWCDVAHRIPRSVLWLLEDNEWARRNLQAAWAAAGLDLARLVFAPRVEPARYRARMALADLFLDTHPCNAGAVASEALRMGLPIVTLAGEAFAARMCGGLLRAIGLGDNVATSLPDYVARAVAIGTRPALRDELRARLAGGAWRRSLGDVAGFTRRLEDAYRRALAALGSSEIP
ncbi:MAG: glycosyl transferase family 1 [Acetobacteraceae bacterium]|nr:glycosyl transferase family 1 [Acetobacteraceae bacterium]